MGIRKTKKDDKDIDLVVHLIREGNETAFEQVYYAYYERLCRFANAIIHDSDYAEHVVDDVMLSVWKNRTSLVADSLWAYLVVATRNRSLKLIQSKDFKQTNNLVSLSDDGQELWQYISNPKSPIGWMIEHELEQQIEDIISKLPEECQRVFNLSRNEGLSYQEISERLGISKNTVKYHMKHALQALRSQLSPMFFLILIIQLCNGK